MQESSTVLLLPAAIGAPLQGGIYTGPIIEHGQLVHLITSSEYLDDQEWEDAKKAAADYRGGDFEDWFLPEQAHLMVAWANNKDAFKPDYHWTSTPYGSNCAWAVYFEDGDVGICLRYNEFRVRPFRRLSL